MPMAGSPLTANAPGICVNGRYLPVDQPQFSFFDRGCQFGDGVHEVIFTGQA